MIKLHISSKMGSICSINQLEEEVAKHKQLRFKLDQVQKIIEAEERRNRKLILKLDALCEQNSDLIVRNHELLAERKALIKDITDSQQKLAKLHRAFLAVEIKASPTSDEQCSSPH